MQSQSSKVFPCLGGDAECEARQVQASADKCKQVARKGKTRLGDMQTHKLNSIYMYDSRMPSRWRWVSKNLLTDLPKRSREMIQTHTVRVMYWR